MKSKDSEVHKANKKSAKPKKQKKKSRSGGRARRRRRLKAKYLKHIELSRARLRADKIKSTVPNNYSIFSMSGNCFWQNYCQVFQWRDFHSAREAPPSVYGLPGQRFPYFENRQSEPVAQRSGGNEWSREVGASRENLSLDSDESNDEVDEEESCPELVLTEEWMQFLEISMRHKASLKLEKLENKKKLLAERNDIEECQQPSIAAENERRHREIAQLYGRRGPTIHGMETAIQLTFNRQIDLFNPSYWPILPFSMKFSPRNPPSST